MLIRSVTAHAFGPLVDATLRFGEGMTVVHGPNESAKSSWHAAIYAALCGRRRGRAPSADERRFIELHRPWDRDDWVVSAEVLLDDGRRVEVRQDLAGRVACDVRDLDLGTDCSDEFLKDGTPDLARWLGLDRHSFLATASVAQAQVLAVVHDRAGGLQEQLQRAASTAGADRTAATALAQIDTYRREQVGTERATRRPLRLAAAAVADATTALTSTRLAHDVYLGHLVEADRLRAEADEARRQLRAAEALTAARTAARTALRDSATMSRQLDEVDALVSELDTSGAASPVDDEALADQVAAALSAWDSRPAEPAPLDDDPALLLEPDGLDTGRTGDTFVGVAVGVPVGGVEAVGAQLVGAHVVGAQAVGVAEIRSGNGFGPVADGFPDRARPADAFTDNAVIDNAFIDNASTDSGFTDNAFTGAGADRGAAGSGDVSGGPTKLGATPDTAVVTDTVLTDGMVAGRLTPASTRERGMAIAGGLSVDSEVMVAGGLSVDGDGPVALDDGSVDRGVHVGGDADKASDRAPAVGGSRAGAFVAPGYVVSDVGVNGSAQLVSDTAAADGIESASDSAARAAGEAPADGLPVRDGVLLAGSVVDLAPGGVPLARSEADALGGGDAAGLTDQQLWDLARDLELSPAPVDPAVPERVVAAQTRTAAAAQARARGRRLGFGAGVLAVIGVMVIVAGLIMPQLIAALVGAGMVAAAFGLGWFALTVLRSGDTTAAARELEVALATAALRAEQAVLAQREGAYSTVRRLGLPTTAAGIRELARAQAARTAISDREEQWRQHLSQASEQWNEQLSRTNQQWRQQVTTVQEQAQQQVSAVREQADQAVSALREQAVQEVSAVREQAVQEVASARELAEQAVSAVREQAEQQISATRQQTDEQIARARQEADLEAAAARARVEAAHEQARAAEQQVQAARELALVARQQATAARAAARAQVIAVREQVLTVRRRAVALVVAAAGRCGITVDDPHQPDKLVLALLRWQDERARRLIRLDDARLQWARLQTLLALDTLAGTAEVDRAVADLRATVVETAELAERALIRANELAPGDSGADLTAGSDGAGEAGLRVLRDAVEEADARANLAEGARIGLAGGLGSVSEAEEELARAEAELSRLRELEQILELTRTFLTSAQERAHRTIAPVLVDSVARRLPATTGGRYTQVIVDPDKLKVQVRGPAGRWRDAQRLSHGTAEQIYLLLRIALVEHLARPGTVCPLLLDDVTVHADTERTEQVLELLLAAAEERQIILFTQQDQVRDWAATHLNAPRHTTQTLTTTVAV